MSQVPSISFLGHDIPRLGFGCWAIGGPFWSDATPLGWGEVDDDESERAIHAALDKGVRFFDTADAYGAGHSEKVLGQALKGRDDVLIATKFGNVFVEATRQLTGEDSSPPYIRAAVVASLRRLRRDRIDLYQLHINGLAIDTAAQVADTLDSLVDEGLIGAYGWSTDDVERAESWADREANAAVQHDCNLMHPARDMVSFCEANEMVSINRSPLAMGFLSGKFKPGHQFGKADVRGTSLEWLKPFRDGELNPDYHERLTKVRELLMTDGRTPAQGALGWIWAVSEVTLPIPGFRTVAQAEENADALTFGPLPDTVVAEIDAALA